MRMRSKALIAVVGAATVLLSGCGTETGAGDPNLMTGTEASCVGLTPARQNAEARLVVLASALAGPTVGSGPRSVLLSPARMRIIRYLKGHGPRIIKVQTAVTKHGASVTEVEDAIAPVAGQRWKLFLTGRRAPYRTSTCAGGKRIRLHRR
jgi:hypothetical protein